MKRIIMFKGNKLLQAFEHFSDCILCSVRIFRTKFALTAASKKWKPKTKTQQSLHNNFARFLHKCNEPNVSASKSKNVWKSGQCYIWTHLYTLHCNTCIPMRSNKNSKFSIAFFWVFDTPPAHTYRNLITFYVWHVNV